MQKLNYQGNVVETEQVVMRLSLENVARNKSHAKRNNKKPRSFNVAQKIFKKSRTLSLVYYSGLACNFSKITFTRQKKFCQLLHYTF